MSRLMKSTQLLTFFRLFSSKDIIATNKILKVLLLKKIFFVNEKLLQLNSRQMNVLFHVFSVSRHHLL